MQKVSHMSEVSVCKTIFYQFLHDLNMKIHMQLVTCKLQGTVYTVSLELKL